MRLSIILPALLTRLATTQAATTSTSNTLNITVLGAQHHRSTLECWALEPGFQTSDEYGTAGSQSLDLGVIGCGNSGNSTYTIIPAGFNGGRHNAPVSQWVIFLSGLVHITLPNSTAEAWVAGGKNGAILALDTADVSTLGHYTAYPSKESTVALEIPLGAGGVSGHRVLHAGACRGEDLWD